MEGDLLDEDVKTKEVETLLGNPKKAILAMAVPTAIALIAQAANNIIDAVWVSGLGSEALAAVGIVFPLFMIVLGISNGIGIGSAYAIGKRVGMDDKAAADNATTHAVVLIGIATLILTPVLLLVLRPLLILMGGADIIDECMAYAFPMTLMMFVFTFVGVMSSVLRAEGAAKRSMYILITAAALNLVLDPIFIYTFGWGLAGAAWATVTAEAVALMVMVYWYFIKKDTFLKFKFKGFSFDREVVKDVLKVGIPSSMEMMIMSIVSIAMNLILIEASGTDAVAIYTSDWRIIQVLCIPLMGIASAVVPVCAAAYGARRSDKIMTAYAYSLKISLAAMILISIFTAVFAEYVTMAFTYSDGTVHLRSGMVEFLRIACVFLPFMTFGFVSASLFQSLGMGTKSLMATIFRNALMLPICYLLMNNGLTAIWWGVTSAEIAGSLLIGIWCLLVMRALLKGYRKGPDVHQDAII